MSDTAAVEIDPRIDKRRVTMKSAVLLADDTTAILAISDYVRPALLDAYVADARTKYQVVEVSEEFDAGPGGYDGQTHVPAHLPVPDAGATYAANEV